MQDWPVSRAENSDQRGWGQNDLRTQWFDGFGAVTVGPKRIDIGVKDQVRGACVQDEAAIWQGFRVGVMSDLRPCVADPAVV